MAIQCQRCGRWLPQIDKHECMDQRFEAILGQLENQVQLLIQHDLFLGEQMALLKEELTQLKEKS